MRLAFEGPLSITWGYESALSIIPGACLRKDKQPMYYLPRSQYGFSVWIGLPLAMVMGLIGMVEVCGCASSSSGLVADQAGKGAGGQAVGSEGGAAGGVGAEDFTLEDLDGNVFHLSDVRGKVVVLRFWATWCVGCVEGLDLLEEMNREVRDRGVEVISVNVDGPGTRGEIRNLVRRRGYSFRVLADDNSDIMARYDPKMILPFTMVLDRDGRIATSFEANEVGSTEFLRKAVEELL